MLANRQQGPLHPLRNHDIQLLRLQITHNLNNKPVLRSRLNTLSHSQLLIHGSSNRLRHQCQRPFNPYRWLRFAKRQQRVGNSVSDCSTQRHHGR